MPAAFDSHTTFSGLTNLFRAVKKFFEVEPPLSRESRDCGVLRVWEDYWGKHVAINKGAKDGIRPDDIFFVIHPENKIVVTNPETQEVLTTYYRDTFEICVTRVKEDWAECGVWGAMPAISRLHTEGNRAIYQHNYGDDILMRHKHPPMRLP